MSGRPRSRITSSGLSDISSRAALALTVHGLIALGLEPHPQQFAGRRFVVDHQNLERSCTHAAVSSCVAGLGIGRVMMKTAPRPALT